MTALHRKSEAIECRLRLEPGSWLSYVEPATDDAAALPSWELLVLAAAMRQGNIRYARTSEGLVLRGEVPLGGFGDERAAAAERLAAWLDVADDDETPGVEPGEEALETALAESGRPVKRRDEGWVVLPAPGRSFEMNIRPIPGGVRIETGLAEFDQLDEVRRRAVGEYALRAHADVRFVRIENTPSGLRLAASADVAALDEELLLGIEAVADARRRLAPQMQSLVESAALAESYLGFAARRAVSRLTTH